MSVALANVTTLYEQNARNIPAMLRQLADRIEQSDPDLGEITEVALVSFGDHLSVFGFGAADGTTTHTLLTAGAQCIAAPFVARYK